MIKVIKNKLMQEICNDIDSVEYDIYPKVTNIMNQSLDVNDNYIIFSNPNGYSKYFIDSWREDFAGLEGNINDFHVNHNLDIRIQDPQKKFREGVMNGLFQKVIIACENVFSLFHCQNDIKSNDRFTIIVSIDSFDPDMIYFDENQQQCSASIRFIKKRYNNTWLGDNLEVYAQAVMTIDFDKDSIKNLPKKWWKI